MPEPTLTDISGIGPSTARILAANGFSDVASVASATVESLARVPGFGATRAADVLAAARSMGSSVKPTEVESSVGEDKRKSGKKKDGKKKRKGKDKKGKKDKKDKKGKKGKKKKKKNGKKKRKK